MATTDSRSASSALIDVLDRIEDYLEQRQDVRDGSDGVQLPNEAMSLLTDLAVARTEWARETFARSERTVSDAELHDREFVDPETGLHHRETDMPSSFDKKQAVPMGGQHSVPGPHLQYSRVTNEQSEWVQRLSDKDLDAIQNDLNSYRGPAVVAAAPKDLLYRAADAIGALRFDAIDNRRFARSSSSNVPSETRVGQEIHIMLRQAELLEEEGVHDVTVAALKNAAKVLADTWRDLDALRDKYRKDMLEAAEALARSARTGGKS